MVAFNVQLQMMKMVVMLLMDLREKFPVRLKYIVPVFGYKLSR